MNSEGCALEKMKKVKRDKKSTGEGVLFAGALLIVFGTFDDSRWLQECIVYEAELAIKTLEARPASVCLIHRE